MNEKDLKKTKVKWFLGGVGIATVTLLIYRRYEFAMIGIGIAKVVNTPELLAKVQKQTKLWIK
jgi:hypothetical protein